MIKIWIQNTEKKSVLPEQKNKGYTWPIFFLHIMILIEVYIALVGSTDLLRITR